MKKKPPSRSSGAASGASAGSSHGASHGASSGRSGARGDSRGTGRPASSAARGEGRPGRSTRPARGAGDDSRAESRYDARSDSRSESRFDPLAEPREPRRSRPAPRPDSSPARAEGLRPRTPRPRTDTTRPRTEAAKPAAPDDVAETPARPALQAGTGKHNLLYGLHAVAAAWVNPQRRIRTLFATEGALEALAPAFARAVELGLERPAPTPAEREQLDKLLPAGSVHQGLALDCAPLAEVDLADILAECAEDPAALIAVLDQVTDPHNVGAVLRSAAAFGARAVVVQDRHAPPVTGVLAKTASGAVDAVPLVRVTNLARALSDLREAGFWCVGLAESGEKTLHELDLSGRTAIVLGSEGDGLRRLTMERCDEIAHLPTGGLIGSLNVSNAAAVALYEVARRR